MALEEAINRLAEAIEALGKGYGAGQETVDKVKTKIFEDEAAKETPKSDPDDPFADLDVDPDIAYEMADLRKSLAKLVDASGETRAIEVLAMFKAKKLSDIKEEDYGKFVAFIEKELA